jgi:predicted transcriptional regulator of viral defense system
MARQTEAGNRGTHGTRLLRALAEEGRQIFSTAEGREVALRIGVPEGYVGRLLTLMVRNGWLVRLRRGLYATSGVASGAVEVHPFAIATRLVSPSAISHWSALNYHGLTEQVPRVVTAFTPKPVVTPSMRAPNEARRTRHAWEVAGVRYEYVSVKKEHFFGIEEVWVDADSRVPITDPERTALEAFISPRMFGGIGMALGILEEHIQELDADKLVEYASRYGKTSVAKRVGWALERAQVAEPVWSPLLSIPAAGHHALDPTLPRRGFWDSRWMILDNLPRSRGQ